MCLLREPFYLLAVDPLLPPLSGVFTRLSQWSINTGRAKWVVELCPEIRPFWEYSYRTTLIDAFAQIEDWQHQRFSFTHIEKNLGDYARIYKHVNSQYIEQRLVTVVALKYVMDHLALREGRIVGILPDIAEAARQYWKIDFGNHMVTTRFPFVLSNLFVTMIIYTYSLGWLASRIRPFRIRPQFFPLASDDIGDPTDTLLFDEIAEVNPILLIVRHPEYVTKVRPEDKSRYVFCRPTDGRTDLLDGSMMMLQLTIDMIRLLWNLGRLETPLFYQAITLPYRRVLYRCLFNKFRLAICWSRDPYNVDHLFRHQELKRIGSESWGVLHSYLTYGSVYAQFRYLSFDRLFVMGRYFCDLYYADTWPQSMKIVGSSTFRISREVFASRLLPKPDNILIMCSTFTGERAYVDFIRGLARAFPNRTIFLQIKGPFLRHQSGRDFAYACSRELPNVELAEATVYELFTKARYAFSDPSGVIIEALQFGLYSFFADVWPGVKQSVLRDFEGFCLSNSDQAAERIRQIESGAWRYPGQDYGRYVDLSGHIFFDQFRENLGLAPKEAPKQVNFIASSQPVRGTNKIL